MYHTVKFANLRDPIHSATVRSKCDGASLSFTHFSQRAMQCSILRTSLPHSLHAAVIKCRASLPTVKKKGEGCFSLPFWQMTIDLLARTEGEGGFIRIYLQMMI